MSSSEHNFAEDVLISGEAISGFTADGDVTLRDAVKLNGEYQVTAVDTAGETGLGVAAYDAASGDEIAVVTEGNEARVAAGGSVSAGDTVTVDANGDFVTAASGDEAWGRALTGGSSGDTIDVDLTVAPGSGV